MKSAIKIGKVVLLSLSFLILWVIGFGISQATFQVQFPTTEASENTLMLCLLLIAVLETIVLWWANQHLRVTKTKRFGINLLLLFGIQFFMSQNEGWYFKDAVGMSEKGIFQTLFGGFLLALGFSALLAVGSRKMNNSATLSEGSFSPNRNIIWLALVIYPLIYFLAGYFIAWQFPAIRRYYTGTTLNQGFIPQLKSYLSDGLYLWQIARGLLWVWIALPFLRHFQGSQLKAALVLGFLFSVLHCVQLLLPNPYMPAEVRYPHLVETGGSVFVWGFVVAWMLYTKGTKKT